MCFAEDEDRVVAQLDFSRNAFSQTSSAQSEYSDPTAGDVLKSHATDTTSLHLNKNCAKTPYLFVKADPDPEDGCAVDRSNPQASPKHTSKEIKSEDSEESSDCHAVFKRPSEPEISSNECDVKVKVVTDKHKTVSNEESSPDGLSDKGSSHTMLSPDSSLSFRSHAVEKTHVCGQCGKSYGHQGQLRIHLRTHTGERPYACAVCAKTFANAGNLRAQPDIAECDVFLGQHLC